MPNGHGRHKYEQIRALLDTAGSHFVAVEFIKKDGSLRQMTIQPEALKTHVVGDAASDTAKKATETRKANNPNLLPVYDVHAKGIRQINMDTILSMTIDGVTYRFEDKVADGEIAKDASMYLLLVKGAIENQFTDWKVTYEYLDYFRKELAFDPEYIQVFEFHPKNPSLSKDVTERAMMDYLSHHKPFNQDE